MRRGVLFCKERRVRGVLFGRLADGYFGELSTLGCLFFFGAAVRRVLGQPDKELFKALT